ncbi:alpha/beta hydrolase [Massilia niastensis]|uniref:alpha/beta hydrolase n=1 Tax=Massilia niastensis TaxID=544911 RepID=UPI0003625354|nr:alpha/beta hydrolase [Massilia niastensis]
MRVTAIGAFALALSMGPAIVAAGPAPAPASMVLLDQARARPVPVALYFPAGAACTPARRCPVALLSPGLGIGHLEYGFLAGRLARQGYLVASIGLDLAGDPTFDPDGDVVRQRAGLARTGAATIRFVHGVLAGTHPGYDWDKVVLVGHSRGGDSSALLAATDPAGIAAVVTLDNRRAALPRSDRVRVLSLRASDTGAEPGVLPDEEERRRYRACIVDLKEARHDDMFDGGPEELKERIGGIVEGFLRPGAKRQASFACRVTSANGGNDDSGAAGVQ